ncbi:MAG: hypothetical protein LC637_08930 [Xanthomonadaceae bacterium]|nr:hypothetical protein [Xanthomonadaceae bacterium]
MRGAVGMGLEALPHSKDRAILAAADVALTASGTVTLEALLTKTPMVVFYHLAPATYHLARALRLVKSRWISLPNVLAGRSLVPERIQRQASAEALTTDLLAWLEDSARRAEFREQASRIHEILACDAAANAAGHILNCIDAHRATAR